MKATVFVGRSLDEAIYVLHAFQKKTQKTRKIDLEIAKRSNKDVLEGRENEYVEAL